MPIGPHDAVESAKAYLTQVVGNTAQGIRVEEIEVDDNGRYWLVTLSFVYAPPGAAGQLSVMIGREPPDTAKREYKIFEIGRDNGTVASMKIRKM